MPVRIAWSQELHASITALSADAKGAAVAMYNEARLAKAKVPEAFQEWDNFSKTPLVSASSIACGRRRNLARDDAPAVEGAAPAAAARGRPRCSADARAGRLHRRVARGGARGAKPDDDERAVAGVARMSVTGARSAALGAPDARVLLAQRLDAIEEMVRAGKTVRCVFDLDNTLFDTRHRTLWCLQQVDPVRFGALSIDDVKEDGLQTAAALRPPLPQATLDAVDAFWRREFWNPDNLVRDRVIPEMMELVRECQRRGAEIFFNTGRAEKFTMTRADGTSVETGFRKASAARLEAEGFVADRRTLLLKPTPADITPIAKALRLDELAHDGAVVGLYVTDGRNDMGGVLRVLGEMGKSAALEPAARFLVGCTFEDGKPLVKDVPVLPGYW